MLGIRSQECAANFSWLIRKCFCPLNCIYMAEKISSCCHQLDFAFPSPLIHDELQVWSCWQWEELFCVDNKSISSCNDGLTNYSRGTIILLNKCNALLLPLNLCTNANSTVWSQDITCDSSGIRNGIAVRVWRIIYASIILSIIGHKRIKHKASIIVLIISIIDRMF